MLKLRQRRLTVLPEIIEHDLDATRPYFVMPWYARGSLADPVQARAFVGHPIAGLELLVQVAQALAAVHAEAVAHRDGKPANVLLSDDGVVLSDFGLCLLIDDDAERLTALEEAVGSRLYIAPENESGINEAVDQRPADFYAFGKILWATLAGEEPPARETQLLPEHRLDQVLGDLNFASLYSLQERLLDTDPRSRLSDWRAVIVELQVAIRRFQGVEMEVATPDEGVRAAARRLVARGGLRRLLRQRAASEEERGWVEQQLLEAVSTAAQQADVQKLRPLMAETDGVLTIYVGSESIALTYLFAGQPKLAESLPEAFDLTAPAGYGGTGSPVSYRAYSKDGLPGLPAISLSLFTSLQSDGIWLLAVPFLMEGPEWVVPEGLLDLAYRVAGPYPLRLEQTVDAARTFSAEAAGRFVQMMERYLDATAEGVDPFDSEVWAPEPPYRSTPWTSAGDLLPARSHLAAAVYGSRVFLVGGQVESAATARIDIYDVESARTTQGPPLNVARLQLAAATGYDGSVYAIGGTIDHQHANRVDALRAGAERWEERAPMLTSRSDLAAVRGRDGRIYAIGGLSDRGVVANVEA